MVVVAGEGSFEATSRFVDGPDPYRLLQSASAGDWPRFHGPDGSGVSLDKQPLPVTWSETENLKWKAKLPGPGSSSPIVVGNRVVVTCWTGYGADPDHEGDEKDLRRHVICLDRDSGKVLWDQTVEPVLPEDPYSGQFTQHGYASHTPVSDGKRIYVFFGKTGVLAFDLEGKKLWQTSVGTGSGSHGWGTASSPILYKDLVIVPASAESKSLVALNQADGKEVWRFNDSGFSEHVGHAGAGRLRPGPHRSGDGRALQDLGIQSRYGQAALALRGARFRFDLHQHDCRRRDCLCPGDRAARRRQYGRPGRRRGRRLQDPRSLAGQGAFADRHAGAGEQPDLLCQQPRGKLP